MRVLVVDDDAEHRARVSTLVAALGHEIKSAGNGLEALDVVASFPPSVIITDLRMPQMDGLEMIKTLKAEGVLPPTIVLTAFGSIDLAISTIHDLGAFWFLEKPVDGRSLQLLLQRAATHGRLQEEVHELRRELSFRGAIGEMVGKSESMQRIFGLIRQVANTNVPVLITGESGTGKELVARAIHALSKRSPQPFVAINCAALPESLIESEVFGHEKGAFTGAVERRQGCLEMAQGGTLFLDELGEMPLAMQAKLLRVLEDFKFRRIGGKRELQADVRILAATNLDPQAALKDGKLREDLYYRVNVFHIELPPLRDRVDDIPVLVQAMIERLNEKHGTKVMDVDPQVYEQFQGREWKGNIRELRNIIERGVILAGKGVMNLSHLVHDIERSPRVRTVESNDAAPADTGSLGIDVGMTVDQAERALIEATLKHTNNNKTRAALILKISPKTLHLKLKQYRMDIGDEPSEKSADASA